MGLLAIGADNDGNSLQKTDSGSWIAALPTPGSDTTGTVVTTDTTADSTTTTSDDTDAGDDTDQSETSSGGLPTLPYLSTATKTVSATGLSAKLSMHGTGTVGIPVTISATVLGYSAEIRTYGSFHFALGDGTAYDEKSPGNFQHTYSFPGSYVVSFEYRSNYYEKDPEIKARGVIDITASTVAISSLGPDGSVGITNSGDTDADLSNWTIESEQNAPLPLSFQIPSGTIVLRGNTTTFPASVTGMSPQDTGPLELVFPSGTVAMSYPSSLPIASLSGSVSEGEPQTADTVSAVPPPQKKISSTAKKKVAASVSAALAENAFPPVANAPSPSAFNSRRSLIVFIAALLGLIVAAFCARRSFFKMLPSKRTSSSEAPSEDSETKGIADSIRIVE